MNKIYLFFILLVVFGSVSGFSIDFNFTKDNYYAGETVQVEFGVNGSLKGEILTQNLKLVCNGEKQNTAFDLLRLNNGNYYSFFNLKDGVVGNCSFVVEDVIYEAGGFLKQGNFMGNFVVNESNNSVLAINPAALKITDLESQNRFTFYLTGDEVNYSIEENFDFIDVDKNEDSFEIYLSDMLYDGSDKIEFNLNYGEGSYVIPIWFELDSFDDDVQQQNLNVDGREKEIMFVEDVDLFDVDLARNESLSGFIRFKAVDGDIENLEFDLEGNISDIIDLQFSNLSEIKKDEVLKEYLYVNQKRDASSGSYYGNLVIRYGDKSVKFPIQVRIKEGTSLGEDVISVNDTNGNGTIKEEEKGSSSLIGVFVIILFILMGFFVYKLYKKRTKNPSSFVVGKQQGFS